MLELKRIESKILLTIKDSEIEALEDPFIQIIPYVTEITTPESRLDLRIRYMI